MSGSGISWAICKSAPRSRQITMSPPHHSFSQAGCPSCCPTNSVKALKAQQLTSSWQGMEWQWKTEIWQRERKGMWFLLKRTAGSACVWQLCWVDLCYCYYKNQNIKTTLVSLLITDCITDWLIQHHGWKPSVVCLRTRQMSFMICPTRGTNSDWSLDARRSQSR